MSFRPVNVHLNDGELIAAQSCHQVSLTDLGLQALGHLLKKNIANGMTQCVVDVLEAVEIDAVDREAAASGNAAQGGFQSGVEERAVGQIGQRIMACKVNDARLRLAPRRDILMGGNPASAGKRIKNNLDGPAILLFDNIDLMLVLGHHVQALAK